MNKMLICGVLIIAIVINCNANAQKLEDVIEKVNPAVVSIIADTGETEVLGAGANISTDGYIITNAHVTENAEKVTVITTDDRVYAAQIIGSDAKTDISLLKINSPADIEVVEFADSDEVRVGNRVIAIGNPFGLGNSASLGIISAKERDIEKGPYDSFLQTDAAINQGNSGGPLFNMEGKMVGLNTAIFSTDGKNMGVGFATPSNQVHFVAEQLKANGKVVRGWIGIGVQKMRTTDESQKGKLVVASMTEKSPAEEAGLQVGDVIEKVGDFSLKNPRDFSLEIAQSSPQTTLPVTIIRDGNQIETQVIVSVMPQKNKKTETLSANNQTSNLAALGIDENKLQNVMFLPEIEAEVYFNEDAGDFVITKLMKDSDAAIKGVEVGNKFKTVNGQKVFGLEDLRIKIKQALASGKMEIQFLSEDTVDTVILNLKAKNEQN